MQKAMANACIYCGANFASDDELRFHYASECEELNTKTDKRKSLEDEIPTIISSSLNKSFIGLKYENQLKRKIEEIENTLDEAIAFSKSVIAAHTSVTKAVKQNPYPVVNYRSRSTEKSKLEDHALSEHICGICDIPYEWTEYEEQDSLSLSSTNLSSSSDNSCVCGKPLVCEIPECKGNFSPLSINHILGKGEITKKCRQTTRYEKRGILSSRTTNIPSKIDFVRDMLRLTKHKYRDLPKIQRKSEERLPYEPASCSSGRVPPYSKVNIVEKNCSDEENRSSKKNRKCCEKHYSFDNDEAAQHSKSFSVLDDDKVNKHFEKMSLDSNSKFDRQDELLACRKQEMKNTSLSHTHEIQKMCKKCGKDMANCKCLKRKMKKTVANIFSKLPFEKN